MKSVFKTGGLIAFLFVCLNIRTASAQTGEITWLGLDFSQAKFIGPASQFKDAGEISGEEFRDKYTVSWNQLFIDEQKKFTWRDRVPLSFTVVAGLVTVGLIAFAVCAALGCLR